MNGRYGITKMKNYATLSSIVISNAIQLPRSNYASQKSFGQLEKKNKTKQTIRFNENNSGMTEQVAGNNEI